MGGQYCARVALENDMNDENDTKGRCGFYSSCCSGEFARVLKIDDMAGAITELESHCPGAGAALQSRCA